MRQPSYGETLRDLLDAPHVARVTALQRLPSSLLRDWHRERGRPGSYAETFRRAIADALAVIDWHDRETAKDWGHDWPD